MISIRLHFLIDVKRLNKFRQELTVVLEVLKITFEEFNFMY